LSNEVVASELAVHAATVGKWRRRFVAEGLDGLLDEPRPGAPRRISDQQVELVLSKTLEQQPVDASHWSRRRPRTATKRTIRVSKTDNLQVGLLQRGRLARRMTENEQFLKYLLDTARTLESLLRARKALTPAVFGQRLVIRLQIKQSVCRRDRRMVLQATSH